MDALYDWYPIANIENLPEDHCVLAYTPDNMCSYTAVFSKERGWHYFGTGEPITQKISHWAFPPADPYGKRYGKAVAEADRGTSEKVNRHKYLCLHLNEIYEAKNHDYGDSFHQTFVEEGMAMARIRLGDKFNRFKTLSKGANQKVADESIRDTLLDLANYAIMTVLEMDIKEGET